MLSVEDRVIHVLEDFVLQGCEITLESSWEELGLDSMDKMEFLMCIEDEFNISVPDEVMEMLDIVGELVKYIQRLYS